ncbi:MAG: EsaB/YukD family protein [Lachnospiraceae bacterium]|nr:EsaB/YukD family protein [Lachnospiraceae bacterium]
MNAIIVTVTDDRGSFYQDMEVPTDVPAAQVREEIISSLNAYRPDLRLSSYRTALGNNRYNRFFRDDETLEEAGVWNGDYLILFSV